MFLLFSSLMLSILSIVLFLTTGREGIVYVDSQKLVNGFKGMQEARKEFETRTAVWKANLDTLRLEVDLKIKEYDRSKSELTETEKALMEELIQSKQEQFRNYQQVISDKIATEDRELTNKVLSKVNEYVSTYGKENGYRIIMAATQYGNIVYAEEHMDITSDLLNGLNQEYAQ